jgi:ABC-type phosphate transport system permease subunit
MILVGGIEMSLFKTKVWWWLDIWALKWCAFLFGMIAGAYLSEFVKQYAWVFALVAVILAVRPSIKYFGNSE